MFRKACTRLGSALLLALALTGCPAARRPGTPPTAPAPTAPAPTAPAPTAPAPTAPAPATPAPATPAPAGAGTQSTAVAQADALAKVAAEVKGVRAAWVVVAGDVAYAGIDVDGPQRTPAENRNLELTVAETLEGAGQGIRRAYVSTKPEVLQSIQNISQGIRTGQPFDRFVSEINKLATEMAPTVH